MQILSFRVKNFKGIQSLQIDLENVPTSVITLVGLNESGKTTILEALAFWAEDVKESIIKEEDIIEEDDNDTPSEQSKFIYDNFSEVIPKNKQDNFTDKISVSAKLKYDESDKEKIKTLLQKEGIKSINIDEEFELTRNYLFVDSTYKKSSWVGNIPIKFKKTARAKRMSSLAFAGQNVYNKVFKLTLKLIPKIIYYPNFLFDFPEKIYLEKTINESKSERFYRRLFQDILDSLKSDLDLEKHIVDRAKSRDNDQRRFLDSVLNKMGNQITKTVFQENLSVLRDGLTNQNRLNDKSIHLEFPSYDENENSYYTRLEIKDGVDNFYIKERSLGFKWFFTFLLFTQFRIHRNSDSGMIFLLDEPASNLHQTAQKKLLTALEKLAINNSRVIYTTHSHHLINPHWLEGAFIVKNKALSYEEENEDYDYNISMTDISIERYRTFVGKYPNKKTYFQPILDVLEYRPSNLENIPDVVMVEGKSDYYYIEYFQKVVNQNKRINILPGMGSGGLDEAIRLYYSWGRNFVILLDSDVEGKKQKKRYLDMFNGIVSNRLLELEEIFPDIDSKKMEIETIFPEQDLTLIDGVTGGISKKRKKVLCTRVQELLCRNEALKFSELALSRFEKLISSLEEALNRCK